MTKPSRPELDAHLLREIAERAAASLPPQPPGYADSDQLKQWHELQVSQIELDMQQQALAELQASAMKPTPCASAMRRCTTRRRPAMSRWTRKAGSSAPTWRRRNCCSASAMI
jgi:hypothetical protein